MGDLHKDMTGADLHSPATHASSHETDGSDEISVSSLEFGSTELKPSALPSLMQLLWELPGIVSTTENRIELLRHFSEDFAFLNDNGDGKPSALPALMQLLWELPGIINTLENKISILAQEVKRINTNFDLNDIF